MPTAETLRALLALVEEAKAGSRELDRKLHVGLGFPDAKIIHDAALFNAYTTSIDAALALVAKVLPGQDFTLHSKGTRWAPGEPTARIRFEPLTSVEEPAATLPLAIIAVMLKAKRLLLLQQSETAHVER